MSAALAQLPLPFTPVRRAFAAPVIAGASNEAARMWLARTPSWPQRRLALWGPAASGKSRLLAHWADGAGALLLPGAALRFEPPSRALAIDDAHRAPPLALLHMLNAAQEAGHPVLLAAPEPPARWSVDLPDLTSRLRAITTVAIEAPEDELLHALLARLLARLPRTHAAIGEAVERLDRAGQALGAAITPALARLVLPDLLADVADGPVDHEDCASSGRAPSPVAGGLL